MSSRQSRWSPTPEQIMILEEMYQKGLRSPNASQIQMLTAHLSLYGKIEGKNVFYWFQNHKARDKKKLKKRLNKQGHYRYHHHHRLFSGPTVDDELSALHLPRPSSAQPRRLHYSHSSPQFQSCPSSSAGYLLQATVVVEEEEEDAFQLLPTPVNFHPRKMDLPLLQHSDQTPATTTASSSCIMGTTTDGRDCIFTMATGPTLPCCTTHDTHHTPLKTLQLFPTSSTKVKEEGHL